MLAHFCTTDCKYKASKKIFLHQRKLLSPVKVVVIVISSSNRTWKIKKKALKLADLLTKRWFQCILIHPILNRLYFSIPLISLELPNIFYGFLIFSAKLVYSILYSCRNQILHGYIMYIWWQMLNILNYLFFNPNFMLSPPSMLVIPK